MTSRPQLPPALEEPATRGDHRAEDFFSSTMPWLLLLVTALPFVVLFASLVLIYSGVEYARPPWNSRSVPSEQTQ
jgi:hypothetical protein